MKRHLIAATAALSLALSGLSMPAMAKEKKDDLIKLLLGAAAVGLILNQANGGKLFAPTRNRTVYDDDEVPPFSRQPERLIPGECAFEVNVNGRLREVVSERCTREFGLSGRLPAECAFDVRTSSGTRRVYGPQCLSDYGYRVASIRY